MKVLAILMLVIAMMLGPGVGFAQSAGAAQATSEDEQGEQYSPGVRRATEAVGGGAAMFLGGMVAGGATYVVVTAHDSGAHEEGWGDAIATILVGTAGAALSMPYGVYKGGELTGGDGSLLASYLGGATGVAVGYLTAVSLDQTTNSDWPLLAMVACPLAGSMIGYELSLDDTPAEPPSSAGLEVYPTLSATPDGPGGVVGLGGRF